MTRYRGEVPSPQANDLGVLSTSSDYYVSVDDKVDWDLAKLNAENEPMEHTVLKTKLTEPQEVCRRADVADFSLGHVSFLVSGDVSSKELVWRTAEMFELQIKYDGPVALLSKVTSDCVT